MHYMITYQKNNGQMLYRIRKTLNGMSIGDETSMGWKIMDIHYEYNGNYLHQEDIRRYKRNRLDRTPMKKKIIRYLVRQLNKLA